MMHIQSRQVRALTFMGFEQTKAHTIAIVRYINALGQVKGASKSFPKTKAYGSIIDSDIRYGRFLQWTAMKVEVETQNDKGEWEELR